MINFFKRNKTQDNVTSVDSFYDENRSRTYKYTELLNKAVFICTDNNITRRALSYYMLIAYK